MAASGSDVEFDNKRGIFITTKAASVLCHGEAEFLAEAIELLDAYTRSVRLGNQASSASSSQATHVVTTWTEAQSKYNLSRQKSAVTMLFKCYSSKLCVTQQSKVPVNKVGESFVPATTDHDIPRDKLVDLALREGSTTSRFVEL